MSEVITLPYWVKDVETNRRYSNAKLNLVFKNIRNLINAEDYTALDYIFKTVNLNNMSVDAITAFPSYAFSVRAKIPSWKNYLDRANQVLIARNINPVNILHGLYL